MQFPVLSPEHPQVALGLLNHTSYDDVARLLDAFVEAGGTLIDTAWIYNNGTTESLIGQWFTRSGARDQVALIGKGAHTPHCDPVSVHRELDQSLERLCTDHLDAYLLHRDNPAIAVAEFVEALHQEVVNGRIRGPVGGSNWTMERFQAAIDAATRDDRTVPSVLSNHFSLAEMNDVIWPGCVSSATEAWRAWLRDRQVINLAWSSQSRGFFTDRAGRDRTDDAEMVRVWYSETNFARRDRAIELAAQRGYTPIHVAVAYTVAQPFPQVPVIGPQTREELHDSLRGLSVKLSADDVRWLETGTAQERSIE